MVMAKKFFTKVLIVLSATAIFLAGCGPKGDGFTQADLDAAKQQGFTAGKESVTIDQAVCQSFIDQTSCQPFINQALAAVVYNATTCAAPVAAAQESWLPSQTACQQAGFGYPAMTVDSALAAVKANGYHCYTPVVVLPTATPKPKIKREEPPVPPECPGGCPVPPPVEPPCASCPVPPGD